MNTTLRVEDIKYEDLNQESQAYFRHTATTIVYMGICWTCCVWQIMTATELAYKVRKGLHFAVVFETVLAFVVITCSVLNPLTPVSCEVRFWISIIAVNLGGCCIQTILLYKAYICYDRSTWLLVIGSIINTGYIGLTIVYALWGQVPTYKDIIGNCVMYNLEWPALAKLGLDIASNAFLTLAFVLVIYRHYKAFGNNLHKSLLSGGIIFSVGVIASNILTAILISARAMGGLSADLYSFDWVITSYLLIKQFKSSGGAKQKESQASPTNELAAEQTVVADILESDSSEEEEDSDDEKGSYVDDIEKCSSFAARHSLESVVVHNKKEISGKNSFRLNDSTFASNTSTTTANTARRDTKRSTATTYIDDFPATYKGVEEYNTTLSPTPTMYANFTPLYSPASHKITCEMCLAPIHGSNYPHKCEKKVEDDV